jgi:hypothetical protein
MNEAWLSTPQSVMLSRYHVVDAPKAFGTVVMLSGIPNPLNA